MTTNQSPNLCIGCTVKQCKNHFQQQDYCSLDKISVATHEPNPTVDACVDCKSFIKK